MTSLNNDHVSGIRSPARPIASLTSSLSSDPSLHWDHVVCLDHNHVMTVRPIACPPLLAFTLDNLSSSETRIYWRSRTSGVFPTSIPHFVDSERFFRVLLFTGGHDSYVPPIYTNSTTSPLLHDNTSFSVCFESY